MTEPSPGPTRPPQPGERRLDRPPSERYRDVETETAEAAPERVAGTSVARGFAYGAVAGLVAAVAIVVLGGVLTLSAGLVIVAAVTGWMVAVGLRAGGGPHLSRRARTRAALVLATLAVALGQLGLWLYARSEGGVLGPLDYLAETFGFLVPIEFLAAWIAAWATARAR